jgi:hypothetical protein
MVHPDDDADEPEQLAGGDGPRLNWAAVAVVVVLIAGAVLLARAGHHHTRSATARHKQTTLPAPAPAPAPAAPKVHLGSVFLQHLLQCTRTDHRHMLSVALGVTNLGDRSLLLLGASGVSSDEFLVQPSSVRIGTQPCGRRPSSVHRVLLGPGHDAVVMLAFRVGTACPSHALVSARVSFDGGPAGVIHADSSQLANLDKLKFTQCA